MIALVVLGMLDGHLKARASVAERLERLQAFSTAWIDSRMQFYPFINLETGNATQTLWAPSGGIFPCSDGATLLKLFRPRSLARGISERLWTLKISPSLSPADNPVLLRWCGVDVSQDLVALVATSWLGVG